MKRFLNKLRRRNTLECEEMRALMSDYVDGELEDEQRRRVDEHVGFCQPCRTVLANLRETLTRLGLLKDVTPQGADDPEVVTERIRQGWREQA